MCVGRKVTSQTGDERGDVAKNTALSSLIWSAFVVNSNGPDWLRELPIITSEGTGFTADDAASAVVGTSKCSTTAASGGTESMGVMTIKLGSTVPAI